MRRKVSQATCPRPRFSQELTGAASVDNSRNFRRIKGLEADHVVVVSFDGDFSKQELYVAASRARRTLTIIASPAVGGIVDLN